MKYRVKYELIDMGTFEVNTKSIEYYESDLLPDNVSNLFSSSEPLPADITVTADEHRDYCDLKLQHRNYSTDSESDFFKRERQFFKVHFTQIEPFNIPTDQDPTCYFDHTTLEVKLFGNLDSKAYKEIEEIIDLNYGYAYSFSTYKRINAGLSDESNWLKLLTEGVKTFIDVFNIFLFLKSIFEKYGPKDSQTQDVPDSEFDSQYKITQFHKYLIAVSRDINTPLDKLNVRFKSVSIDGTYMLVETEIGTYSVQFNNNQQIIMLNKLDD